MVRGPPRSTRFPYTPLCRSPRRFEEVLPVEVNDGTRVEPRYAVDIRTLTDPAGGHVIDADILHRLRDEVGDRKSTRLNSSHANIPYAVFCLKNKTQYIVFIH